MKRWVIDRGEEGEYSKVDAFIQDLVKVMKKHGMTVGHEDGHGAFIIEPLDDTYIDWLENAHVNPHVVGLKFRHEEDV